MFRLRKILFHIESVCKRYEENLINEKDLINMTFDQEVYQYLKKVPKGKVVTYGMIARAIGRPRASRLVGNALHRNPTPVIIPCHRVVNREGRLAPAFAFGGTDMQAELLRKEGVEVKDGYVDLSVCLWEER